MAEERQAGSSFLAWPCLASLQLCTLFGYFGATLTSLRISECQTPLVPAANRKSAAEAWLVIATLFWDASLGGSGQYPTSSTTCGGEMHSALVQKLVNHACSYRLCLQVCFPVCWHFLDRSAGNHSWEQLGEVLTWGVSVLPLICTLAFRLSYLLRSRYWCVLYILISAIVVVFAALKICGYFGSRPLPHLVQRPALGHAPCHLRIHLGFRGGYDIQLRSSSKGLAAPCGQFWYTLHAAKRQGEMAGEPCISLSRIPILIIIVLLGILILLIITIHIVIMLYLTVESSSGRSGGGRKN